MKIDQKKLEKIKNQIKKQDKRNLKNYQKNGYEGFLTLLDLKDKNPQTLAEYLENAHKCGFSISFCATARTYFFNAKTYEHI